MISKVCQSFVSEVFLMLFVDSISRVLLGIVKNTDPRARSRLSIISEIFQALVSVLPRIDKLVGRSDFAMSDSITIQSVFIAIGPFFVAEPATERKQKGTNTLSTLGGTSALRGLRLSALSLIRSVSAILSFHETGH